MKKLMLFGTLLLLIGGIGIGLTFPNAKDRETQTVEKSFDPDNIHQLQIKTKNSSVTIEPSSGKEIDVTYEGDTERHELVTDIQDDILLIQMTSLKWNFISLDFFTKTNTLTIHLPEKLYEKIAVNNENGTIRMNGIETEYADLQTENGSINAQSVIGSVHANTSNGAVKLHDIDGDVTAETANGAIRLTNITGAISGETSNGAVSYSANKIVQNIDLESSNGAIKIILSDTLDDVTLQLQTELGSTKVNDTKDFQPVIGDGTYEINLKTSVGSVKINDQQTN